MHEVVLLFWGATFQGTVWASRGPCVPEMHNCPMVDQYLDLMQFVGTRKSLECSVLPTEQGSFQAALPATALGGSPSKSLTSCPCEVKHGWLQNQWQRCIGCLPCMGSPGAVLQNHTQKLFSSAQKEATPGSLLSSLGSFHEGGNPQIYPLLTSCMAHGQSCEGNSGEGSDSHLNSHEAAHSVKVSHWQVS